MIERWKTSAHLYADVAVAERACQIDVAEKVPSYAMRKETQMKALPINGWILQDFAMLIGSV